MKRPIVPADDEETSMIQPRIEALRRQMQTMDAGAFLVTNDENRRYLSGFTGSSGALVVTSDGAYIVTDFRYYEQVEREVPAFTLYKQSGLMRTAIGELLDELQPARLGFEADSLTVAQYKNWRGSAPESITWVATDGLLKQIRARKDDVEIRRLRRAQEVTDQAFERFLTLVQPGKTELALAWELEVTLHELGAEGPAFETIVAAGENASLPHYRPGDREVQSGDMVLVDFGAVVDGYHADMTRTLVVGEPDDEYRHVYEACLGALTAAEETIHAGMNCREAHEVAHEYLRQHDYGDNFGHSLGHGVGLSIHEEPALSPRAPEDATIPGNSAVTIEPGIYIPGWGGIRIEDLVIVGPDGVEILTQSTKDIDAWRHANR